jgi:predicted negative regulator of RcsB-dependent stress response
LEARKTAQLEDPGAELLDKAQDLWERYGRIVLIAGVVVLAAVVLGFFTLRSRKTSENEASGRLAEASALFFRGEYARSLELARQISQQFGSTPSGIDAHRLAGDNSFWMGDVKTAISEYRAYLARQKSGMLSDAVRRSLAYSLESEKQYAEAAGIFDGLVGKFDRESSAEFLTAAARCYTAVNQPAEARKRLQRVADEFGETSFAETARIRLAEIAATP